MKKYKVIRIMPVIIGYKTCDKQTKIQDIQQ